MICLSFIPVDQPTCREPLPVFDCEEVIVLVEPARTNYDLHFRLLRVPVRVHPLFWVATFLLTLQGNLKDWDGKAAVIWVGTVFVSIMVHEFGHAFAFRRYQCEPRVVLYWLGGLAIPDLTYTVQPPEGRQHILVSAAGPAAGFVLAAVIAGLLYALGWNVAFFDWTIGRGDPVPNLSAYYLFYYLLQVNIVWGLVNLLPVYPLDGGQISRELFTMRFGTEGVVPSLKLSLATGIVAAVASLMWLGREGVFPAVLFGSLAYASYATLKQDGGFGGGYGGSGGYGGGRDW
jgi:stage IV sporulation protein FB